MLALSPALPQHIFIQAHHHEYLGAQPRMPGTFSILDEDEGKLAAEKSW